MDHLPELDWETRSADTPLSTHMLAGSIAGLTEHILLLPLDIVKTHLQISDFSLTKIVKTIKSRGLTSFYAGGAIVGTGCVPSHAIFFLNYEFWRSKMEKNQFNFLGNFWLGATSALYHDLIMTPCDMLKQRKQLTSLPYRDIIVESYRMEGLRSFWRSLPVNFVGNLPSAALTVTANENLRVFYHRFFGDLTLRAYFVCAGMAGAFSAFLTTPLDNIRTRLNTQVFHREAYLKMKDSPLQSQRKPPKSGRMGQVLKAYSPGMPKGGSCDCGPSASSGEGGVKYPNALCAVKIIMREEGLRGFFKGATPRVGYQSVSSALSWTVYEFAKGWLMGRKREKN